MRSKGFILLFLHTGLAGKLASITSCQEESADGVKYSVSVKFACSSKEALTKVWNEGLAAFETATAKVKDVVCPAK